MSSLLERSSGNEPWIFRAASPDELVGRHRRAMAEALRGDERLLYLIYSPLWTGRGDHFGIRGIPASHAVAVTAGRFVISRDLHRDDSIVVFSVPFEDVIVVEKGSALLLAWLVIRYAGHRGLDTITVLHKSTGAHHFDELIRRWRAHSPPSALRPVHIEEKWKSVPRYLYHEVESMLLEDEHEIASLHSAERWTERRRLFSRRPMFVKPWASFLCTDRGLLFGVTEAPERPQLLTFGANVIIAPREAIAGAAIDRRDVHGFRADVLRVDLQRRQCAHVIEVPFDEPFQEAETVAAMMRYS